MAWQRNILANKAIPDSHLHKDKTSSNQFCYLFYATDNIYCQAVLAAIAQLRRLKKANDIDIVVIHFGVSKLLVRCLQHLGATTIARKPDLLANDNYYRYTFMKLKVFQLEQYEKILFLDADSLSLQNLDHLFLTEMKYPIYMPTAYWMVDQSPFYTSAVMLLKPSKQRYDELIQLCFELTEQDRGFDMDILNQFFAGRIGQLDPMYCCLNSEWETDGQYNYFGDQNLSPEKIMHVHFSALGKPWQYEPDQVPKLRPEAHPFFYQVWATWWDRLREAHQLLTEL